MLNIMFSYVKNKNTYIIYLLVHMYVIVKVNLKNNK